MSHTMQVIDLGRQGYQEALELQKQLLEERIQDRIPDTLILVEHTPIYTVGRAMSTTGNYPASVMVPGIGPVPVVAVERGGKMTYHGPGQIVGYPIFQLAERNIRRWLRDMERAMAKSIALADLHGSPVPESLELEPGQLETGLWVGNNKVGSIGIAVKHWVSYHGFALNVATDMRYFEAIEPCGFSGNVLSSVAQLKGLSPEAGQELVAPLKAEIARLFSAISTHYSDMSKSLGNKKDSVAMEGSFA